MKRKWIIAAGIAALIVIIVIIAVSHHGGNSLKVTTEKVATRSVKSSVLASGQFAYKDQVELRSQVSGQLVSVPIQEGDTVKQGEVVLQIDPNTYQANVDQQKAQVELQQDAIQEAQLKLDNLKKQWDRNTKLFKQGLIDANSYDTLTNQYHLAQVDVASSQKSLSLAKAQLNYAQEQLAKTVIRSPLNGIVTELDVKVGESVIPGTPNIPGSTLMAVGDPSNVLAEVNVDEADIAHINVGEEAEVTSTAYPNTSLKGTVKFVAPAATTMPGQQGQGFLVKIRVTHPEKLAIRPGMTCRAEIYSQSTQDTLAVPVAAVLFSDKTSQTKSLFSANGAYVFVDDNGKAKRMDITLGISNDTWQVVKAGLKAGEKVISGPYDILHTLANGSAVEASAATTTSAPSPQSG
ncbi:MAG: efflux RND transporter periplasmic adaptor subunit [Gammaproteobacteria bacterium]